MIDPWQKRFELKSKVTHLLLKTGYVLKYFRNEVSNCVSSLHDTLKQQLLKQRSFVLTVFVV